jgi:predicted nucleotidyltransferase
MVINYLLQYLFSAPSNIAVLRVLNLRVIGISGRETARLANLSIRTAQNVLAHLESFGVVKRTIGGRDHLFVLNRQNQIVKKLIYFLFEFENNFQKEIISLIKKNLSKDCSSLILFGSVARREETLNSDFDLCIVYNKNRFKIDKIISELRDSLYSSYKITLAPFYMLESEFKKRALKNLSPINNILKEGIVISGKSIHDLTKRNSQSKRLM